MEREKKLPYYYKDYKGRDCIAYEVEGASRVQLIPDKGMPRYLFEHCEIGELEYYYANKEKQERLYVEEETRVRREMIRDRYSCVHEGKRAVRLDEPLYDNMDD